jgi:hypothetical protein
MLNAACHEDAPRRLLLDGHLKEDLEGPWLFRTVTGTTPDGLRTRVIWRKRPAAKIRKALSAAPHPET